MRLTIDDDPAKARDVLATALREFGLVAHKDKAAAREAMGMPSLEEQAKKMRPRRDKPGGSSFTTYSLFAPPIEPLVTAAKAGGEVARFVIDNAVRDLVDRVRQKGTPSAKRAADLGDKAVNTAKAALGKLSPELHRALIVTGGGVNPARHKALASLQRVTRPSGKNYGVARLVDAVEGRLATLSPAEKQIVQAIQRLTQATGKMLNANGVQQQDAAGNWKVFTPTPGGKAFLRHPTPEGFGIVMRGPASPGWREMVEAISDLNHIPQAAVGKSLKDVREGMLGEGPDGSFRRVNAEFTRQWKQVPTHLYINGDEVPVLQTFPFLYAKGIAESTAARVGFVKHFGQDTAPNGPVAQLRKQFLIENGNTKPLIDMTRALNNAPIETPILPPGSNVAKMARAIGIVTSLLKSGMLSLNALQHIGEPLGNVQAFGGAGDLLRAVARVSTHPQATLAALQSMGGSSNDVANLAFQPGRTMQSIARVMQEVSSRAFMYRYIHDFKARLGGAVAMEKVERMQAGKGNAADVYDLMKLGWELPDARRLARGNGTPAEYARVVRQAPAALLGANESPAQHSRLNHSRIAHAALAFQQWFESKARSFVKEAEAYVKAMKSKDPRLMVAANVRFARSILGTAASHMTAYALITLATGGVLGLKIAFNEAKEHPLKFLAESWLYQTFGGPFGAALHVAAGNTSLPDTIFPFAVGHEFAKYAAGTGPYRDKHGLDALAPLVSRFLPIDKAALNFAATLGFNRDAQHLDVAKRAYWRWRFAEYPPEQSQSETTADSSKFKLAMKGAYADITGFKDPTANIAKAFGVDHHDGKAIAQSMRSHLLLTRQGLAAHR